MNNRYRKSLERFEMDADKVNRMKEDIMRKYDMKKQVNREGQNKESVKTHYQVDMRKDKRHKYVFGAISTAVAAVALVLIIVVSNHLLRRTANNDEPVVTNQVSPSPTVNSDNEQDKPKESSEPVESAQLEPSKTPEESDIKTPQPVVKLNAKMDLIDNIDENLPLTDEAQAKIDEFVNKFELTPVKDSQLWNTYEDEDAYYHFNIEGELSLKVYEGREDAVTEDKELTEEEITEIVQKEVERYHEEFDIKFYKIDIEHNPGPNVWPSYWVHLKRYDSAGVITNEYHIILNRIGSVKSVQFSERRSVLESGIKISKETAVANAVDMLKRAVDYIIIENEADYEVKAEAFIRRSGAVEWDIYISNLKVKDQPDSYRLTFAVVVDGMSGDVLEVNSCR